MQRVPKNIAIDLRNADLPLRKEVANRLGFGFDDHRYFIAEWYPDADYIGIDTAWKKVVPAPPGKWTVLTIEQFFKQYGKNKE